MARLRITVGTRYVHKKQVFIVRELLLGDTARVENLHTGMQQIVPLDDLYSAWDRGDLKFEARGPHVQEAADELIPTEYTIADFDSLPEHQRAKAWRRYRLIKPLLKMQPGERTNKYLDDYARSVNAEATDTNNEGPVSRASLTRWISAFKLSGYDIRALVAATGRRGGKGSKRLNNKVDELITQVLAECAAKPAYRTAQDVYLKVVNRVADENRYRAATDRLPRPGYMTVYRRIRESKQDTILRRRSSRVEAQADAYVGAGPKLDHVLQRIEIDHTRLDIVLVDLKYKVPLGRPTLTLALDVYSGFPFGIYVGFEDPSYLTVMSCLEHGILRKPDYCELYGTKHNWPVFGLPEELIVDNGKEFVGKDLSDACAHLGIELTPLPVKSPWLKGAVERFFGTANTGFVHLLPGSPLSNIMQRGDYDPTKDACMSLDGFMKALHIWLLDEYAQSYNEGRKGVPAKLWHQSVEGGFAPELHISSAEVRILLGRVERRKILNTGLDLWGLRYNCPDLYRLRGLLPKGSTVKVKYDPRDISRVHVLDTTRALESRWIEVPALDQTYTRGLSWGAHRQIRKYVLDHKADVNIEELANAKARIQQVVADEFKLTKRRKVSGLKKGRRFLDATAYDDTSGTPGKSASTHTPIPARTPLVPPVATDTDELDMTGFSADYDLPTGKAMTGRGGA